jgi:hypothetical protein
MTCSHRLDEQERVCYGLLILIAVFFSEIHLKLLRKKRTWLGGMTWENRSCAAVARCFKVSNSDKTGG